MREGQLLSSDYSIDPGVFDVLGKSFHRFLYFWYSLVEEVVVVEAVLVVAHSLEEPMFDALCSDGLLDEGFDRHGFNRLKWPKEMKF